MHNIIVGKPTVGFATRHPARAVPAVKYSLVSCSNCPFGEQFVISRVVLNATRWCTLAATVALAAATTVSVDGGSKDHLHRHPGFRKRKLWASDAQRIWDSCSENKWVDLICCFRVSFGGPHGQHGPLCVPDEGGSVPVQCSACACRRRQGAPSNKSGPRPVRLRR